MQATTIVVLVCLVAAVAASVHYEYPAQNAESIRDVHESLYDTPVHERNSRTKRSLLLLKKKLLLGALGLKAAKVGAVGAGVVGAIALKKHYPPTKYVEVHSENAVDSATSCFSVLTSCNCCQRIGPVEQLKISVKASCAVRNLRRSLVA